VLGVGFGSYAEESRWANDPHTTKAPDCRLKPTNPTPDPNPAPRAPPRHLGARLRAARQELEGGEAADLEPGAQLLVVVRVDLADDHARRERGVGRDQLPQLLILGSEGLAVAAPGWVPWGFLGACMGAACLAWGLHAVPHHAPPNRLAHQGA